MITAILYLFNALVLCLLGLKSYQNYRRNQNNIISKQFVVIGFTSAAAYVVFVIDIYYTWINQPDYAAIAVSSGMLLFFFSMMGAAILAGWLSHQNRAGRIAMWGLLALGLLTYAFSLLEAQLAAGGTLIIDGLIVTYPETTIISHIFAVSIFVVYTTAFVIFLRAGMKNPHVRKKLFLLAFGLLVTTWGGTGLVISSALIHHLLTYGAIFIGYILLLIGIFTPSRKETVDRPAFSKN